MSTITRKLPVSNIGRLAALTAAKNKKDSTPPSGNILSDATSSRLDTHQPLYTGGMNAVDNAQAVLSTNTPGKNIRLGVSKMMNSHFIQVFNFAVDRGEAPAGHRSFLGLEVTTGNLPPMVSEAEVLAAGTKLISGDANRITAGGVVMSMPTITQVTTAHNSFQTTLNTQSNLNDNLDTAQEAVDVLNTEADSLIRRMWAEMEAFYAEETIESRRDNLREWGVIYVTIGNKSKINIHVTDTETGDAIEDAFARLQSADMELNTNSTGDGTFNTDVIGDEILLVSVAGYSPFQLNLTIVEGVDQNIAVTLTRLP